MNNIYALKYSAITDELIVVSELARKVTGGKLRKLLNSIFILSITGTINFSIAAELNITNVWVRDYMDLAQNKGVFKEGNTNVQIKLKNGSVLTFPNVPIPDFSAVSSKGTTTSIGGAYSITAAHNGVSSYAVTPQTWGQTNYTPINRITTGDFAIQRLNKYVVETLGYTKYADTSLSTPQALERYGVELQGEKVILGFRAGSGETILTQGNNNINTFSVYNPLLLSASMYTLDWEPNATNMAANFDVNGFFNQTTSGDSGSGYYIYDNISKDWVILGSHYGITKDLQKGVVNTYQKNLVKQLQDYFTQNINLSSGNIIIKHDSFMQENDEVTIEKNINNQNKDLVFSGGGLITIKSNLNLGYGGVVFKDEKQKYTINGHYYHILEQV